MDNIAEKPGLSFGSAILLTEGDTRSGLRYILMRLRHVGLTDQDVQNLADLVSLSCQNKDVGESADRLRKAESVSPLALAIADIVQCASPDQRKPAALGAIFGAHGAVGAFEMGQAPPNPIGWAISGAVSACSLASLDDRRFGFGLDAFLTAGADRD
jgi:hypothetical protein